MGLKLNGATSGSIELDPQADLGSDRVITLNATGNSTLTLPDANGTLDRLERAGNILQVVQNYITSTSSTVVAANNTTFMTNFSQSITPTYANSKILVRVRWTGEYSSSATQNLTFRLFRDSALVGNPPSSGSRRASISVISTGYYDADAASTPDSTWFEYLDSPNTTSSIEYKLAVITATAGTMYTNRTASDINSSGYERLASSITLIEVAA